MEPTNTGAVDSTRTNGFLMPMARRVALWGSTIVGFLGFILAINASLDSGYVGAGLCLMASALAFGAIGYTFVRK